MAEQVGSIFTTVGVSISKLKELGQVSRQLKTQLGVLGGALISTGTKLEDLGRVRLAPGTILDQFGKPITSKIQMTGTAITSFGSRLKDVGKNIQAFGASMSRALGIALKFFIAYRIIRGVLAGITKGFQDIKALEIEEIFTEFTFAGESAVEVLQKVIPLSKQWGVDIVTTYRSALQIARALGDMYEMDLPTALALTNVAMKITVASGQNLNETISNMVGYVRILGLESVADINRFMSILYAAAFRTNEALTASGKSVKGGALAMDTLTDAIQRMLPSMKRFGMDWEQIAAIASVFITNLDEAGQGIGAYTAKLFEAIKGNQQLKDAYEDVGITLTRQAGDLIPALIAGYDKMTNAQKDVAAAATRVGIGAHIVATFWESLTQIQERSLDIKNKSNLLDEVAIRRMGTLQKKQDQFRVSMQALSIQMMRVSLPAFRAFVDFLTKAAQDFEWTGKSVGISIAEMVEGTKISLKSLLYGWTGQVDKLKEMEEATKNLRRVMDDELGDIYEEVFGVSAEALNEMIDMQLKLQAAFVARRMGVGVTADDVLILEDAKRVMQEYAARVKIAANDIGIFASEQEIGAAKVGLLTDELAKLEEMLVLLHGLPKLEVEVRISELKKELAEINNQRRAYNRELLLGHKYSLMEIRGVHEQFIIEEKIRDLKKEQLALKELGLKTDLLQNEINELTLQKQLAIEREIWTITNRLEDISVTGLMGVIEGTKTWQNILEDIGQYTIQEIIRGLIQASLIGETLRGMGGNIWGLLSSIASFGVGAKTPTVTTPGPTVMVHQGGPIPRYDVGGEVLGLLKPGEYVVREGPAQKYKGLLEAINAGRDIGGGADHYYMFFPHDMRTFAQYLMQNKEMVQALTRDAQRQNKVGFR